MTLILLRIHRKQCCCFFLFLRLPLSNTKAKANQFELRFWTPKEIHHLESGQHQALRFERQCCSGHFTLTQARPFPNHTCKTQCILICVCIMIQIMFAEICLNLVQCSATIYSWGPQRKQCWKQKHWAYFANEEYKLVRTKNDQPSILNLHPKIWWWQFKM